MGNEQQGLTDTLAAACDQLVRIPMRGRADSLNLAVSTGLMIYEALQAANPALIPGLYSPEAQALRNRRIAVGSRRRSRGSRSMQAPKSSAKLVTVFGGSGFLGRYVVQALARRGHRIRVAVRRPDLAGHLQPLGMVGQIKAIQANLRYRWSVDRAVEGADAVVNLVGILAEGGRQTFDAVQAFGPRAIGEAARAQGIANIVHVSAIGVDQPSTAGYMRTKAEGEAGLRESDAGGGDHAALDRLRAGGRLLQPLRGDGADLAGAAADRRRQDALPAGLRRRCRRGDRARRRRRGSGRHDLRARRAGGADLPPMPGKDAGRSPGASACSCRSRGSRRGSWAASASIVPGKPITLDQVRMLMFDNVVSAEANEEKRTLEGLGIEPTALEIVLPTYLERFREHGEFAQPARVLDGSAQPQSQSPTSPATPTTTRHQANGVKPWRATKPTSVFTTKSAATNATTKPIAMMPKSPPVSAPRFL